jgi:hypothetical protein
MGERGGEWDGRGFEPNGTATEHREGGGPFDGLKWCWQVVEKSSLLSARC